MRLAGAGAGAADLLGLNEMAQPPLGLLKIKVDAYRSNALTSFVSNSMSAVTPETLSLKVPARCPGVSVRKVRPLPDMPLRCTEPT